MECSSQCQRPNCVIYKEIVGDLVTCVEMCSECPVLHEKLYGTISPGAGMQSTEAQMGVCCGRCGTTMLSVRTGNLLGCAECYSVFEETLMQELLTAKVPKRMRKMKENTKKPHLHTGKTPDQAADLSSASRIVSLNEALKEALKKENYEQAAWLRDQIKALTEKAKSGQKNEGSS